MCWTVVAIETIDDRYLNYFHGWTCRIVSTKNDMKPEPEAPSNSNVTFTRMCIAHQRGQSIILLLKLDHSGFYTDYTIFKATNFAETNPNQNQTKSFPKSKSICGYACDVQFQPNIILEKSRLYSYPLQVSKHKRYFSIPVLD